MGCLLTAAAHAELLEGVRFSEPVSAESTLAHPNRLRFELPRAAQAPQIDGELTDACWQEAAAHLGKFRLGLSALPARHTREAWATYDDQFLYLGVKLAREPGTQLRVLTHQPDNPRIWNDDELEVFLDPFNTGTEYYQLIMNSEGVLFDAAHSYKVVPDPGGVGPTDTKLERETEVAWSSGLVRAVAIHDEYWSAEMALPLRSIGLSGAPAGHSVGFNITSADWDTDEYTCLSPTSDWHDPHQFGLLALGEPRLRVEEVQLGRVGQGKNLLRARVADLSGEAGAYTLALTLTTQDGRTDRKSEFALEAGGAQTVGMVFEVPSAEGRWELDMRILDARGRPVYAARRAGALREPMVVGLKSHATFTDGRPVMVAARLGVGSMTAQRLNLEAQLLDSAGRVVATQDLGPPRGANLTAWLPVEDLQPGVYRLQVTAVSNGKVVAQAEDVLRVGASPFARTQ